MIKILNISIVLSTLLLSGFSPSDYNAPMTAITPTEKSQIGSFFSLAPDQENKFDCILKDSNGDANSVSYTCNDIDLDNTKINTNLPAESELYAVVCDNEFNIENIQCNRASINIKFIY